jgi:hypothetical protein
LLSQNLLDKSKLSIFAHQIALSGFSFINPKIVMLASKNKDHNFQPMRH